MAVNTEWLSQRLEQFNIPQAAAQGLSLLLFLAAISIFAVILTSIVRRTLLRAVIGWIEKKRYRWGEPLLRNRFFDRLIYFVPLAVFAVAIDSMMERGTSSYLLANRLVTAGFVIVAIVSTGSLLSSIMEIDLLFRKTRRSILQGYVDALKIVTYVLGAIFIISIF